VFLGAASAAKYLSLVEKTLQKSYALLYAYGFDVISSEVAIKNTSNACVLLG
jgi:hypothetical protein